MNFFIGLFVIFLCFFQSIATELISKVIPRNDMMLGQALYHSAHKQHTEGGFTWDVISGTLLASGDPNAIANKDADGVDPIYLYTIHAAITFTGKPCQIEVFTVSYCPSTAGGYCQGSFNGEQFYYSLGSYVVVKDRACPNLSRLPPQIPNPSFRGAE